MKSLSILEKFVPNYDENFRLGKYGLEEMPLLDALFHTTRKKEKDLSNVYLVACQHLLEPQLKMFQHFIDIGINPENILILPKVYSANADVTQKLDKLGCTIFKQALAFNVSQNFDSFHEQQCKNVCSYVKKHISKNNRLVVLDDGGSLLKAFAKEWKEFPLIYGVEQTASGKRKLLDKPLPFYVNSVASSIEKISIETDYIIRHSFDRMKQYFGEYNITQSSKILVIGKGPIGNTMIESLKSENYLCDGYDITDNKSFPILDQYDVIIGATGVNSISLDQLVVCKRRKYLISLSSSDREFPAPAIRNLSTSFSHIHDTFIYKNIHLINGGFPITFKGERYECYPLEMDVTMVKLSEAIVNHLLNEDVPNELVNEIFISKFLKRYKTLSITILILGALIPIIKALIFGLGNERILSIIVLFVVIISLLPDIKAFLYWLKLKKRSQKPGIVSNSRFFLFLGFLFIPFS